jgi:GNAT superfamily N-acetyltransferase
VALVSHQEEVARLRDGTEVRIARLTPADAPLLAEAFAQLSEESRRLRFLGPKPTLSPSELRYLTEVDGHNHEALCAVDPASKHGVAIARFVRDRRDPTRAEVAITVADEWQHRGLGKLLLGRLADRAREEGVRHFTALVSSDNRGMQGLIRRTDRHASITQVGDGVAEYEIAVAHQGLGHHLEEALRAAAAGHLRLPPRVCELLRSTVPLHLHRR